MLSRICYTCGILTPRAHCHNIIGEDFYRCDRCKEKGRTEPAQDEDAKFGEIPPELSNLSPVEKNLIAITQVHQSMFDLPKSSSRGLRGRVYVAPLDKPQAVDLLANLSELQAALGTADGKVHFRIQGSAGDALLARPSKLVAALHFLAKKHASYKSNAQVKACIAELTKPTTTDDDAALVDMDYNFFTHGGPAPVGCRVEELQQ
eukprot:968945-Amphidinium_carterae.1